MSDRVYVRKFDWDEARQRYAAGETITALANEYGVTYMAVWIVVRPGKLELSRRQQREWQLRGRCDDCEGPMNNAARSQGSTRCVRCARAARATSVREDSLRCVLCREWKPDDDFPLSRSNEHRRGRHKQCRVCSTNAKREYRHRNPEKANAYDREYKRRRRAEARASRSVDT